MKTMKTKLLIILLTIIFLTVKSQVSCYTVANTYTFTFGTTKYRVVKELKTWQQAAACAVADGGHLVEINSASENTAVYNGILAAGVSSVYTSVNDGGGIAYVWIGATDRHNEGTWLWDGNNDGIGVNFWNGQGIGGLNNGQQVGSNYNNWGRFNVTFIMEPDDFNSNQDACGIALEDWPLGFTQEWNDIDINNNLYYVIEYPCLTLSPIASVNNTLCVGSTINLSASISGSATPTYSWSGPNSFTSNVQNPVIANASTLNIGTYTLTINNGGCVETATTQITLVSPCTGIYENSNIDLLVNAFPNPFNDELTIDVNEPSQITITNALGQVIKTVDVKGKTIIETNDLPKALYILSIKTQNGSRVIKLVKE
jgi:hypothetical protein